MNKPKFITLDNGLTILIYSDKTKMTNHMELTTFLGGTNLEYKDKFGNTKKIPQGTAHLLEHYICECSEEGNYIDKMYKLKALSSNAETNYYNTKMYFNTVYNFKECLITLLKAIYNIEFTKEKLDKTKYAVFHEIRDYKDQINRKKYSKRINLRYGKKISILGSKTSISSVTPRMLEEIYKTFYVPKNQFLLVAGSFDEEEILTIIKEFYSKYRFDNNKRHYGMAITPKTYNKETIIEGNKIDELILSYKIPINHLSSFEKYKQDWYLSFFVEMNLLFTSKLNEELKRKNLINGNISAALTNTKEYKVLEIYAYTKNKKEVIKIINNILNNIPDTQEEFELYKKNSILRLSVRSDNISTYVIPVAANYLDFDYKENDNIEFVETLNYIEYKETLSKIDFSKYSTLTIKDK